MFSSVKISIRNVFWVQGKEETMMTSILLAILTVGMSTPVDTLNLQKTCEPVFPLWGFPPYNEDFLSLLGAKVFF